MRNVIHFLQESNRIEDVQGQEPLLDALFAWQFLAEKSSLTEKDILAAHGWLMAKQLPRGQWGQYRKVSVQVGTYIAPPSDEVPFKMAGWTNLLNDLRTEPRPHHVAFERIHPFVDGNGRLGRILMNWQRIRQGLPILVIHYDQRDEYYAWFK